MLPHVLSIYMQIVSAVPYCVNKGRLKNRTGCFDLFSDASDLKSLQATYLKFADYSGSDYLSKIQESRRTMGIPGE